MRRSIRIAAVPQTAKHARRIAGGPQTHHRFRRARQAANRRHASEATPPRGGIMAHRAAQRRGGGFRYVRERSNAAAAQHVRQNFTFKTGGVDATGLEKPLSLIEQWLIDTSCLISKRYALNDILEAYRTFEEREDDCLKVVITPWENAKTPQPKRRQEGHDKKPWSTLQRRRSACQRRTLQPIGDKSEKPRPPMLWPNKFSASRRATRVSKPKGPAKCS